MIFHRGAADSIEKVFIAHEYKRLIIDLSFSISRREM